MSHEQGGPALRQRKQAAEDLLLRAGVQRRRGFVAQQDGGVLEESTGEGDALLLPAAQLQAPLPDLGVVAVRKGEDAVVDGSLGQVTGRRVGAFVVRPRG